MTDRTPIVPLYPYQRRWVEDESRFKIVLKARQTGFSFGVGLETIVSGTKRPEKWVLLSAGERQSKELIDKVRMHAQAFGAAADFLETEWRGNDGTYKQLEVVLPNGTKIIGLPANPDTARGFSGNVVLDEFAFHKDSRAIWRALFPIVSRGYKLRIVSTPNGKQNMYYSLWSDKDNGWSRHRVDIYDAVADGLPFDIEKNRAAIGDPDSWAQEYECQFIDAATALLPYELIESCEDAKAALQLPDFVELLTASGLTLGMDVGRKKDLTNFWLLQRVGDVLWTRGLLAMLRAPFAAQRDVLFALLALPGVHRACLDATGIGMQLAEEAAERFGTKAEAVTFTNAVKSDLALTLRRRFEDRRVRIPADRAVREDLHSVRKTTTSAGNIRFDAARTDDGHADRFWSLALAVHADNTDAGPVRVMSVPRLTRDLFDGYGGITFG